MSFLRLKGSMIVVAGIVKTRLTRIGADPNLGGFNIRVRPYEFPSVHGSQLQCDTGHRLGSGLA